MERACRNKTKYPTASIVSSLSPPCAIPSESQHSITAFKHQGFKGVLIQVFIVFFHSLHKRATVVQIHTQSGVERRGHDEDGCASLHATLAANQVRFPGTTLYTSLSASNVHPTTTSTELFHVH